MSFGLIFTYLMAYGGSAVALFNPFVGLLIYVCFAVLRPGVGLWAWSVPVGANFSRILALSLLAGWVANGLGNWNLGRATFALICLGGYLGWNVLSATQALVPDVAWHWVESQAKVILPCLVAITVVDSVAKVKALAWVILLSHGYVAYDLNLAYLSGFNRLVEMGFGSMDNNCMSISLVSCIGLGTFFTLSQGRWWLKAVSTVCTGLMVHCVLISNSRGGMLGLILVGVLSFLLMPKRLAHCMAFVLGVAVVLGTTGPAVLERFGTIFEGEDKRDRSASSRLDMWGICFRESLTHPLVGLGPHHFPVYAASFGLNNGKEAHTTWLQLLAEIGYPGAAFLLLYYAITVVRLLPLALRPRPGDDPWVATFARLTIVSTLGFMFTAQFVTLPGLEAPYYLTLLGVGILRVTSTDPSRTDPETPTP